MAKGKAATKRKAPKGGKKKKDPKKPKRGLSSFMFYCKDKRAEMKEANPEATFGELGKLLGAGWKELGEDDKKPYEEKATADKERYKKAMESYVPPESDDEEEDKEE